MTTESPDALSPQRFRLLALLVSILVACPLLVTQYLTLFDYPNHVARYSMISRFQGSSIFQDYFSLNDKFIPNLGFDVVATNLSKVLPVPLASQITIFLSVFGASLGLCYLAKQLQGRATWFAFLPPVFLWSFSLIFGFNNYLLAFAFFPWALLAFERYLQEGKAQSLVAYVALTLVTFVCHAQVAAISIAVAFIFGLSASNWKRGAFAFLPVLFIVPLLVMSPSSGEFSHIEIGNWKHKIRMFFQAFLTGFFKADLVFFFLLLGSIVYFFVSKSIAVPRRLQFVFIGCLILCLLMPLRLKIASNLDTRMVPIMAAVVFAFFQPSAKLVPKVAWLIGGLLFFRSATMAWHLRSGGIVARHVQEEIDKLPDNAIVFNAVSDTNLVFTENSWNPPVLNLAYFGMWRRPIFMSGLYSYPNQQPMVYSEFGKKLDYLGLLDTDTPQSDEQTQLEAHYDGIGKRMGLVPREFWNTHQAYVFVGTTREFDFKETRTVKLIHKEPKFMILRIDVPSRPYM